MSNDKTTLADVQPGGRVRLGNAAPTHDQQTIERVAKAMQASEQAQSGWTWADCSPIEVEGWMELARAALAALSAQPSPGGQQSAWILPDDARIVGVIADNIERGKLDHPGFYRNTQLAEALRRVLGAAQSGQRFPCGQLDDNDLLAALRGVENYLYFGDSNPIHTATVRAAINALAARQPVGEPVAVPGTPTSCKHCGSTELQWFAHVRTLNDVQQGRLNTHEVGCVFVLGCEECSETLRVVKADEIAALLNAAPPAQAVALGKLPRAVELLSNVSRTLVDWAADEQREAIDIIKALSDSQAVGNG